MITSCADLSLTSDQALMTLFTKNEPAFSQGVQIMRRHPDLFNVGPTIILSNSFPTPIDVAHRPSDYRKVLSDADWNVLQSLFEQLHIKGGIKVYPLGVTYFFAVDRVSIWNGDTEKGIVYSERPLSPLFPHLDRGRIDAKVAYKKLKPKWYLYLSYG